MNTWGICCPGPSLELKTTQTQIIKDDLDVLVAVNCAVFTHPYSTFFTYWAMLDVETFESSCRRSPSVVRYRLRDNVVLWIPNRWLSDIPRDYDPLKKDFNGFKKETFSYGSDAPFSVPIPNIKSWWNYTLFVAIAEAITRGARHINIYGADMCGTEYFKPGFRNGRTRHNDKRWAEESKIFNIIKYECKKQDICIVRR